MDEYVQVNRPPLPTGGPGTGSKYGSESQTGHGLPHSSTTDMLRTQEPPYRTSRIYIEYKDYINDAVRRLFSGLNELSVAKFGAALVQPEVKFVQTCDQTANTYAQYVPKTNTIIVYDLPTFEAYLNSRKRLVFDNPDRKLLQVMGHELGHELISNGYLSNPHTVAQMFSDVERRLQIEEAAAELIGYYAARKASGKPTASADVARDTLQAAADAGYHNGSAVDRYIMDAKNIMAKKGFNPNVAAAFIKLVNVMDATTFDAETKYLYPSVALAKALVGSGMPLQEFLAKLFENPTAFKPVQDLLSSMEYTDEVVRRYINQRQREAELVKEGYQKLRSDEAARNEKFDPRKPLISESAKLILEAEYKVAMELAGKFSQEMHNLQRTAEEAIRSLPTG